MHVFLMDKSQNAQIQVTGKILSLCARLRSGNLKDLIFIENIEDYASNIEDSARKDAKKNGQLQKLISVLDGKIPVLGVIKSAPSELPEVVVSHNNVLLLELNDENLEETVTAAEEALYCNAWPAEYWPAEYSLRSCGAVVFRQYGSQWETLLIQSKHGNWSFPKGRMKPGETEPVTAAREIREETGISPLLNVGFRKVVPSKKIDKPGFRNSRDVVFFLAMAAVGNARPQLTEINELKWFPASGNTVSLIGYPPDRQVFFDALRFLGISL